MHPPAVPGSGPNPGAVRADAGALILSALAAVFWGTNFEATRIVLEGLPPWTAAGSRFLIASVAILVWLAASRGLKRDVLRLNLVPFIVLGVVGVAGFNAALFVGMESSSPVTAALIMGTSPLTTTLLDAAISRRWPEWIALVGMAISLLGVALTVGAFSGAHFASGDILIAAGSVAWALYTIGCRRWVDGAEPLETTTWTMVFGAGALVLAAVLFESPAAAWAKATPLSAAAVVYMALVGSVLAYLFWQVGVAVRGPGATSVLFNLVPVSALVVAAVAGRMPDLTQIAGVIVAIFGVLLASGRAKLPRHQPAGG